MPVILPREKEREWLADIPLKDALALLKPLETEAMKVYPVPLLVNSPANDTPEAVQPLAT